MKHSTPRLPSLLLAALFLGVLHIPQQAKANCPIGSSDYGLPQWKLSTAAAVPVYLVVGNGLTTFVGLDKAQTGRAVGRAIELINRYSMANVRLKYGGELSIAGALGTAQGVFVYERSSCTFCPQSAIACMTVPPTVNGSGDIIKAGVNLVTSPGVCYDDWAFYPDYAGCVDEDCADDIVAVLVHELIHVAGFAHSGNAGNCTPADNSSVGVMNPPNGSSSSDTRYLSRDDIDGLVSLYGRPPNMVVDYHYSADGGQTWTDGALFGATATYGPVGSVAKGTEGETKSWVSNLTASSWTSRVRGLNYTSVDSAITLSSSSWQPVSVANGDGVVMVARFVDETAGNNSRTLQWARSANSGSTWSYIDALRDGVNEIQTRRNGLGMGYDPKTERFVAVYQGDDNLIDTANGDYCDDVADGIMCDEVRVATIASDGTSQAHTLLGVRSTVAPFIACGDTGSTQNCIITWAGETGNACIHWGHGHVNGDGTFTLYNNLSTNCTWGFSPVGVVFDEDESATPWRFAFTQEHSTQQNVVYTGRKTSSYTSAPSLSSFTVSTGFRIFGDLAYQHDPGSSDEMLRAVYVRR
jgi:hypothetical protein